jgi:hypothetical protein
MKYFSIKTLVEQENKSRKKITQKKHIFLFICISINTT